MVLRSGVEAGEDGMNTAEYALGTVAACSFACVLLQLLPMWRVLLVEWLGKILERRLGLPSIRLPL